MSLPKIVKTIFYVDPSHGRNYAFDVNQDTSFESLKGILAAAANVNKIGLRIFHKQTKEEYTKFQMETLLELFPKLNEIEFIINIDRSYTLQNHDQLKLGSHCKFHPDKFCIFYCFDCEVSLCSLCIGSGEHQNHALSEKFDYLKPSHQIVNNMFADLDDIVDNVSKNHSKEDVEKFKLKLQMDYFPSLVSLLKKIELKLSEQVDNFNKHCEISIKTVKTNTTMLKEHCTEGLNELKYQIDIENMLRDEGVFLHFDYKVKEMSSEKDKILDDTNKLDGIIRSFAYIKMKLENIYTEIKVFLEKYLNASIYDDIRKSVHFNNVNEIQKENILTKLLSEFKKQNGRIISEAKNRKTGSNFITKALDSAVFNLTPSIEQANTNFTKPVQSSKKTGYSYDDFNSGGKALNNISTSNNTIDNFSANKNRDSYISEKNALLELEGSTPNQNLEWLIQLYENDTKIVVYAEAENHDQKVVDRTVKFNPSVHGITSFLKNAATLNTGKLLYISGGEVSVGHGSDFFFVYNPQISTLQRREDMPVKKYSHSLIFHNDYIYSVGGYKTNSCERYDVKLSKWTKLSPMNVEERVKPILYVNDNFLYAFFGYTKGSYEKTIERISLKSAKSKWEYVAYNNPEKLDLPRIEAAIIPNANEKSQIYLLGGKNEFIHDSVLKFDFKNNTFESTDLNLEEKGFFKESNFLKFKAGDYGLFNANLNQLLKLCLNNQNR